MARCSVITGSICAQHDLSGHPECNARLAAALSGVPPKIPIIEPESASLQDITRVHNPSYLHWLRQCCANTRGISYLDTDTYITPHSFDVAAYAAGAAINAVERALDGEYSFSLMRPPGHHAENVRAMGFCLLNNTAIAASKVLDSVDRVAIVDWDVHHGNGTQHCFFHTDRVLYCSVHQWNAYPFSGAIDETGSGLGEGYTINSPLRAGASLADYQYVFSDLFAPAIERFNPDIMIISAGQDILSDDPLGMMEIQPPDFEILTRILEEVGGHPLALVLEGGYGPSHGEAITHIFKAIRSEGTVPECGPVRQSTVEAVALLKKLHYLR